MSDDFGNLVFNKNHRRESVGLQALNGMRLVLLSFVLYAGWTASYLVLLLVAVPDAVYSVLAIAMPIAAVVGFGTGAYGTYLVVDALGWAKYLSLFIIASFLIPYFRLAALLVIASLALVKILDSGYRISLFGKPVKRPLPAPPA